MHTHMNAAIIASVLALNGCCIFLPAHEKSEATHNESLSEEIHWSVNASPKANESFEIDENEALLESGALVAGIADFAAKTAIDWAAGAIEKESSRYAAETRHGPVLIEGFWRLHSYRKARISQWVRAVDGLTLSRKASTSSKKAASSASELKIEFKPLATNPNTYTVDLTYTLHKSKAKVLAKSGVRFWTYLLGATERASVTVRVGITQLTINAESGMAQQTPLVDEVVDFGKLALTGGKVTRTLVMPRPQTPSLSRYMKRAEGDLRTSLLVTAVMQERDESASRQRLQSLATAAKKNSGKAGEWAAKQVKKRP